jgi:3-oxoacyl-(acyl-carrier-protein) synthase
VCILTEDDDTYPKNRAEASEDIPKQFSPHMLGRAGNLVATIALQARRSGFLTKTLLLEDVEAVANILRTQNVVIELSKVVLVLAFGVFGML